MRMFRKQEEFKMKQWYLLLCITVCMTLFCTQLSIFATIVVIAPHPDDGEASCGGLIANAVASGEEVIILTMTGGELGIGGKSIKK